MSQSTGRTPADVVAALTSATTPPTLIEMTRAYAQAVVGACRGNKSLAAKQLGIGRRTLYRILAGGDINFGERGNRQSRGQDANQSASEDCNPEHGADLPDGQA